jgi:hypothetical protein
MKTETFKGTIESAYGKPVSPILKFEGEYQAFETVDELKEKNEFPKDEDIVDFVNNRRKANARQKAMQAQLDNAGYEKPTLDTDPQLQLKTLYKVFIAAGKSDAEARAIASSTLGVEWSE